MGNPLFKAYEKLDEGIMYGVNKGVKAWNWTTGKDKCDLSNYLLDFSLIPFCLGAFSSKNFINYPLIPIQAGLVHLCQKENIQTQKKEDRALEKGLKFIPNKVYETTGFVLGVFSGIYFSASSFGEDSGNKIIDALWGLTALSLSLSHYVMRAENLPPRKSAFKLAKEKLIELYEKYKPSPSPVPQPAFGFVRTSSPRKTLEDNLF
jgi:hypothetical protein